MGNVEMFQFEQHTGRKVVELLANIAPVQKKLAIVGAQMYGAAQAQLGRHHTSHPGSNITLEHGRVDWTISLEDIHGAAGAIEYGNRYGGGGVHALAAAVASVMMGGA